MEPPEKKIQQQLPDDIWSQILLRLPAITVIKLKIVCKSWCDLINSKNFQISHFDHWRNRISAETKSQLITLCKSPPQFLSIEPDGKLNLRPLRFDQPFRRSRRRLSDQIGITVLHSDDGILLLRKNDQLFLFNPLTNSYLFLPFPENSTDKEIHNWIWSFVYDPSSRSYVIFYARTVNLYSLRIEMNGSGTGEKIRSWRQVWSPEKQTLVFRSSMSINSNAYFLFTFRCNDTIGNTGILTIDAATEKSLLTNCSGDKPKILSVFFGSGRKFYGLNKSSLSEKEFELSVIDDVDNPTWERHVIIKLGFIRVWFPNIEILKEGDTLLIVYCLWNMKRLFIYDISLKKCREAKIDGNHFIQKLMPIHFSLLSLTN